MIKSRAPAGIAFVILSVVLFTGCRRTHSYDWQLVDLADGRFKVSFPGQPTPEAVATKSASGGSFTSHVLRVKITDQVAYGCTWFDDPSLAGLSVEDRLNQARDHGISGVQGTLLSEKRLSVQGYPARDIQVSARGHAAFDNRIILVGTTLYSLMVADVSGNHDSANVQRFFNSLTPR